MKKPRHPSKFRLDEDDRLRIKDCLRRSGYKTIRRDVEKFYSRVEERVNEFRNDRFMYYVTPKSVSNDSKSIQKLIFNERAPSITLLQARIKILPLRMFIPINHFVQPAIESFYFPLGMNSRWHPCEAETLDLNQQLKCFRSKGFQAWSQTASGDLLLHVARCVFAGVTKVRNARLNQFLATGKFQLTQYSRIGAQYEVRGQLRHGRITSMIDMIRLIGALLYSWEILTGKFPRISRDDSQPFSQLIYLIFELLGQAQSARTALREFIKKMKP